MHLISVKFADSNSRYYLDVTLVNHYGKAVSIITANTNTTRKRFVIPVGGSYQIRSTHLTTQRLYITAHDAQSFFPITINGKQSITITARDTPVSLVYFIPLGESTILILYQNHPQSGRIIK